MPLHILADDEHYVVKVRLDKPYQNHEVPDGLETHTWVDTDEIPASFVPHCYWDINELGIFTTDAKKSNRYAYKQEQHEVIDWAKKNIYDPAFQTYARHGHAVRADIFHAFVVMNVMAALHVPNILGGHWDKVKANLVPWQDFTRRIQPNEWVQNSAFNYATFIETPVNQFVPLRSSFRMGGVIIRGTRQITVNPVLIDQAGAIVPIHRE